MAALATENTTRTRASSPVAVDSIVEDTAFPLPAWLKTANRSVDDPVATARGLRPLIEANAAEGERLGYIPDESVKALAESGLWGLLVPKALGGIEADPETYISTIEELAYADSSVGWVMMASTFGISGLATMLGPKAVDAVFRGDEGFVASGQIAPLGKAVRLDGGYRISGRFQFGSGCRMSSWMFGAFVLQRDGKPEIDPDGNVQTIWAVVPRSRLRLDEASWDVAGLRATASYDYEIIDQFVDDDFVMMPGKRDPIGGPVFSIGVSIAHVSWALGSGMRILDEIKALAVRKQRPGRLTLIHQPTFQRDFAEAVAELEAARAYVRKAFANWYEAAAAGKPQIEIVAQGRLAACWATKVAASVGRFAYLAGGSDGARNSDDNRLQRYFRDLHVGATHKHVDDNVVIECGSVLLGVSEPDLIL